MIAPDPSEVVALLKAASILLEEKPAQAAETARTVLDQTPDHPQALRLLGVSNNRLGHFPDAASALERLRLLGADDAELWQELGEALFHAGDNEAAHKAALRAIELQHQGALSWLLLASIRTELGDEDGSNATYLNYLQVCHGDAELSAAAQQIGQRQYEAAAARLNRRLRRWPGDIAAMRMLAELHLSERKTEEALSLLEEILIRAPGFHAARQNLAVVLNRLGRHEEAVSELDALLMERPDDAAIRDMRAVILSRIGDVEGAIKSYQDLVRRTPGAAQVWHGYGHVLKAAGRSAEAIDAYRRSIAIQPCLGSAWWSLANLKTLKFSQDDITAMRGQLDRSDIDPESRMHFEFALAKALEDRSAYADAFSHYARGNKLRRQQLSYDARQISVRNCTARNIYSRQFFEARRNSGCQAPDPIFVVGMPRAGSTLVEQILSSHPLVEGTAELPAVIAITQELRNRTPPDQAGSYHPTVATLDRAALTRLGEDYMARTRTQRRSSAPYFIDKMPNNFAHIGLIKLMLPNAKIIDVRRHPMACCFSNFKQNFARGQTFSYDLGDLGAYYRDYVGLMAHFDAALPGAVHRVVYEHLVDDTEQVVRSMLDYCGIEFDQRCLRHSENQRVVRTASSEQVRQPIFREGLDHWKHFEPWLGPLKDSLGTVLDSYPDAPPELLP